MKKSLYDYGPKGTDLFLVYCVLDEPLENQIMMVYSKPNELNSGRPWMCKQADGMTGVMGMTIWAYNKNDAITKMAIVKQKFNDAEEEPPAW